MPAIAKSILNALWGRNRTRGVGESTGQLVAPQVPLPAPDGASAAELAAEKMKVAELKAQLALFTGAMAVAEYAPDGSVISANNERISSQTLI